MDNKIREELYLQAKTLVLEAGAYIKDRIDEPLEIDIKSNVKDLVTQMDKEVEKFFASQIKMRYPHHLILSEEGYGDEVSSLSGTVWIIDPIDGTTNFIQQKRNFAISVGIYHDGIGEIGLIYNVMDEILYHAKRNEGAYKNDVALPKLKQNLALEESMLGMNHYWLCTNRLVDEKNMQHLVKKVRGTRSYGSAALEFAFVAEGIINGYLAMRLAPWDFAAGIILVNEIGGVTTDITGRPINMLENSSIITCHSEIHSEIIENYLKT